MSHIRLLCLHPPRRNRKTRRLELLCRSPRAASRQTRSPTICPCRMKSNSPVAVSLPEEPSTSRWRARVWRSTASMNPGARRLTVLARVRLLTREGHTVRKLPDTLPCFDQGLESSPRRRHLPEAGPRYDDRPVVAPHGAGIRLDIADGLGRPAGCRNSPELGADDEPYPLSVRREERTCAAFSAADALRPHLVQAPSLEAGARPANDIDDCLSVRRQCHRRARPGTRAANSGTEIGTASPVERSLRAGSTNRAAPTATAPAVAAATIGHSRRRIGATRRDVDSSRPASASSSRASPMCCNRRFGSFCRQRRSSRRTPIGYPRAVHSTYGSARSTAASVSATSSPLNSRRPGQHLVEHRAERPDVAARVDRPAPRLLRAHVGRGAEDDARARSSPGVVIVGTSRRRRRVGLGVERLGQPEVEHLHGAVRRAS